MDKYLSVCSAKEVIKYSFDNAQITDYQDNISTWEMFPFLSILILKLP